MGAMNRYVVRGDLMLCDQLPQTPKYKIGIATYGTMIVTDWSEGATLEIGAYSSFAHGVQIFLGGEHNTNWVTTYPFTECWPGIVGHIDGHPKTKGNIVIGSDVWVGTEALILSGVHIGHGAVVGARAVVTKDIPPYSIAIGNPIQIVGRRFHGAAVGALLRLCWWDWPEEKIKRAMPDMCGGGVETFIRRAEQGEYDVPMAGETAAPL